MVSIVQDCLSKSRPIANSHFQICFYTFALKDIRTEQTFKSIVLDYIVHALIPQNIKGVYHLNVFCVSYTPSEFPSTLLITTVDTLMWLP